MKDFTEEVLKYVDGLDVSEQFLKELQTNEVLIRQVSSLQSDIEINMSLEDSQLSKKALENLHKKDSKFSLIIESVKNISTAVENKTGYFLYSVSSAVGFNNIVPQASRNDSSQKKSVYLCKNIEVTILEKTILLSIKSIKEKCSVIHNNKIILSLSNRKNVDIELKKGDYIICVDNYEANIYIS